MRYSLFLILFIITGLAGLAQSQLTDFTGYKILVTGDMIQMTVT
jgi:hypothetical protein